MKTKKLYRSRVDRKILGVCGGIGEWIGIDSTFVRIALGIAMLYYGLGIGLYVLLAFVIPLEPYRQDDYNSFYNSRFYSQQDTDKQRERKDVTPPDKE